MQWFLCWSINTIYDLLQALKTDLDLPLTKRNEHEDRQIDSSTSSFGLATFKEPELSVNNAGFSSSCIGEHGVPPPLEHSAFNVSIEDTVEWSQGLPRTILEVCQSYDLVFDWMYAFGFIYSVVFMSVC